MRQCTSPAYIPCPFRQKSKAMRNTRPLCLFAEWSGREGSPAHHGCTKAATVSAMSSSPIPCLASRDEVGGAFHAGIRLPACRSPDRACIPDFRDPSSRPQHDGLYEPFQSERDGTAMKERNFFLVPGGGAVDDRSFRQDQADAALRTATLVSRPRRVGHAALSEAARDQCHDDAIG